MLAISPNIVKILRGLILVYKKGGCSTVGTKRNKHIIPSGDRKPRHEQPSSYTTTPIGNKAKRHLSNNYSDRFWLFIAIAFFTALFSAILLGTGISLFTLFLQNLKYVCGAVILPPLIYVIKVLVSQYEPKKSDKRAFEDTSSSANVTDISAKTAGRNESWIQSTRMVLKNFITWLLNNRLNRTVAIVSFVLLFSSVLAHGICEGVSYPGLRNILESSSDDTSANEAGPIEFEESEIEDTIQPNATGMNEADSPQLGFLNTPDRYVALSEDEESSLFFYDGPFAIPEGVSASEMAETLHLFVQELLSPRLENLFDQNASEELKADVARASELEKEIKNSDDLDQVIALRMQAWQEAGKYSIATLLANNMQAYAQAYTEVGGHFTTIKYYHAQSIFWSWKSLSFKTVNSYMLKDSLEYIRMRYHDIADEAAFGSEEQLRASDLSDAFQILENMEFSFD